MLAQPGWPALVNTFHIATITQQRDERSENHRDRAWRVYPVMMLNNRLVRASVRGVNKTVCVTSMSEFIKVKSYARFRRLLPTRQAKSLLDLTLRGT